MLRCPKCRGAMDRHESKGHYGAKLSVFKCPECFGLWVDGKTVLAISRDSAIELESEVTLEDVSTEPRKLGVFCPRCEINLVEQTGGGMPKGLRIDYCKDCQGYWFDKGELMIYKTYLEGKRKKFADKESERRKEHERRERAKRLADLDPVTWKGALGGPPKSLIGRLLYELSDFL